MIETLLFSWQDTSLIRPKDSRLYAILNDSDGVKDSSQAALGKYDIVAMPWSKKEDYKAQLVS